MRIYVTGALGFVGGQLLPKLRAAGHEPLGFEREVDITDRAALESELAQSRPDALLHLAAQSSVAASLRDPLACYRVNFEGTRTLLAACEAACPGARIVLVGSGDQYGNAAPGAAPFKESAPLAPASPYARSKAAAEWLGTLAAEAGHDVVRVRAFNHTGPGQNERFVASSFARQVAEISLGKREARMRVGNLDSVRDFLDVRDVADAYLELLRPETPVGVYNVASGHSTTIREMLELLFDISGKAASVEVNPEFFRPTDTLVGDAAKLHGATGWSPRFTLRDTLAELFQHWRRELTGASATP